MKAKVVKAKHRTRVYIAWQVLSSIPERDQPPSLRRAIGLLVDTITARPPRPKASKRKGGKAK